MADTTIVHLPVRYGNFRRWTRIRRPGRRPGKCGQEWPGGCRV